MASQPEKESVRAKTEQLLEDQMENVSLMNAVAAASQTDKPYCCCYCTRVVNSFATLSEATAFRDSSHILLTIARYSPRSIPNK